MDLMIEDLMEQLIELGGSDMHLQAGAPVYFRISGKLQPISEDPLTAQECQKLIFSMLNNTQRKDLEPCLLRFLTLTNWDCQILFGK
jgi:twitching motility protein PilT